MPDELANSVRAAEEEWLEIWVRGPQPTKWTMPFVQTGDPAPHVTLLDSNGEEVELSHVWADDTALILFWRHFGCGCGVDRAALLKAELNDYQQAGANVVVVGQGDPARAAVYAETYEIGCPILVDADGKAYEAYGLTEGTVPQLLFDAPESYWTHSREIGLSFQEDRRAIDRPLVDNPWLLPGEFVVDSSGIIHHAHRYQHCEDFPDPRVLTTAIKLS